MNTTRKIAALATAVCNVTRGVRGRNNAVRPIEPLTTRFTSPTIVPSSLGPVPLAPMDEDFEKRRQREVRRLLEQDKAIYTHELAMI